MNGTMFDFRAFLLAKDPSRPKECQDAFAVDAEQGVAAVADGVSSSLFARRWAELLVGAVVSGPPQVDDRQQLQDWLDRLRDEWAAPVEADSLPYYQKPKFRDGAFSTLLWVEVQPGDSPSTGGVYRCRAVGDCCLFHVHRRQVMRWHPVATSDAFTDRPASLCSVRRRDETIGFEKELVDECQSGDMLALCTDALAAWTLKTWEQGRLPPFDDWWAMSERQWQSWLASLRQSGHIRSDDTTLVLLKIF